MGDEKDREHSRTCWKCKGNGRKFNKKSRAFDGDHCKVCDGSGRLRPSSKAKANAMRPGVIVKLLGDPKGGPFLGPPAFGSLNGKRPSSDLVKNGEILASLGCGDWRIYQLAAGHKLTVDDFICAWVASTEMRSRGFGGDPQSGAFGKPAAAGAKVFRHADLGCGCGSVLMTLAWAFPGSILSHGVEAQSVSFGLLKRGLLWNMGSDGTSPDDTVRVELNDLRTWEGGDRAPYDLITGTPPYFSEEKFTPSANHRQKVRCRVPTRGAAASYVEAAGRLLAKNGVFVMVEASHRENEKAVLEAVERMKLRVVRRLDVVTRVGLPTRFSAWVITRLKSTANVGKDSPLKNITEFKTSTFVLRLGREQNFKRSPEYLAAMKSMGWIDFEGSKEETSKRGRNKTCTLEKQPKSLCSAEVESECVLQIDEVSNIGGKKQRTN
mmetsp:Transcript_34689/g.83937  ORF Transcript_34689/g.83937 Transcript_34689/m.83937 type:complete len:437 (-) Transcript_34689:124-1434(-)